MKNEFSLLMNEFPKERRFIVSYILSTLLNNISNKKTVINFLIKAKPVKLLFFLSWPFMFIRFVRALSILKK